ncbi:MAG: hypothetical protein ACPGUZ_02000 [Holosporaceae bacterium]
MGSNFAQGYPQGVLVAQAVALWLRLLKTNVLRRQNAPFSLFFNVL